MEEQFLMDVLITVIVTQGNEAEYSHHIQHTNSTINLQHSTRWSVSRLLPGECIHSLEGRGR